jgi:uncharacterized protein related to proFAR isomerase
MPAISILNGTIVITRNNKYESLTIDNKIPDALDLIELITEKYETIYLADINGLNEKKPQINLIRNLTDFCEIWLEAGVVEAENIYDLLVAGAQNLVLSTKTLDSLMELANAFELSENLVFEIDYSEGSIISPNTQLRDMPPNKLAQELKDIGLDRIIFADLDRIGTNFNLKSEIVRSLVELDMSVYIGGGIKVKDVYELERLGTSGAIIELTDILQYGRVKF